MKKKKKTVPYSHYLISIVSVAVLASAVTILLMRNRYEAALNNSVELSSGIAKVQNLYDEILSNYVGEVDKEQVINGALKGMTDALDDPYTSYLNQDETDNLNNSINSSIEGIGAMITIVDGQPVIAEEPLEDTPAAEAGIKAGDILLKVDGEEVKDLSLTDVVAKVRGKKGTKVSLEMLRGEENLSFEVTRGTIALESVTSEITSENEKVGMLKIESFSTKTATEVKAAIKALRKKGAESFIIDVRGNPGGILSVCEEITSMFLEDGQVIVKFQDKAGNETETVAGKKLDGGFKVTEPVVVLVDGSSASASEIFAAALKESGKKEIIGTKTYGKGTAQELQQFSDGSEIKISSRKWLTPKGEWLNKKGLEPSIVADYPEYAYLSMIDLEKSYTLGANGNDVKNIQEILKALDYYTGEIDGNYSETVAAAVMAFQNDHALEANGNLDGTTSTLLMQQLAQKISANDGAYLKALEVLQ